jgi:hypothetical protein
MYILTSTIGKKSGDFLTHEYIPLYFTFRHTEKLCSCSCRRGETVSEMRPPTGLSFIPQIDEYGQRRWNDTDRGQPKI